MENRKLTDMQKKFANYYIEEPNAAEAARKAGYSKNSARQIGTENLSKPYIRAYIDKQLKRIEEESIADATEVLQYLTRVMRGEETETEIISSMGEDSMEEVAASIRDRTRAAELIGRRHALFTDNIGVEGIDVVKVIDDIPNDTDDSS